MDTETGEIVHPKIEREQPTESPTESDESKTLEVTDNEDTYEENQPTELSTESVLENEGINIDTDNTKKYKLDIEELPEVESDKVNRYNVELPKTEVKIEEQPKEEETNIANFVKGKARRTDEGYEAIIDEPELTDEEKKEVVKEILDKKNASNRGFSKPIPNRPAKEINKNIIIRKRKGK
jgi:hypothetical protein